MKTKAVTSLKDLGEIIKEKGMIVREVPSIDTLPEVIDIDLDKIKEKEKEHSENLAYAKELGRRKAVVERAVSKLSGMKLESEYAKSQLANAKMALEQTKGFIEQLSKELQRVAFISALIDQIKADTEDAVSQLFLYLLSSNIEKAVELGVIRKMTLADINKARKDGRKYPDNSLLCHIGGYLSIDVEGASIIAELKKLSEAEKAAIVASMKSRATINMSKALDGEEGFIYLHCPKTELSDGKKLPEVHLLLRAKKYKNVNHIKVVDVMGGHSAYRLYMDIKKADMCLPISYVKSGRIDTDDHMEKDEFYNVLIFLSDIRRAEAKEKETKADKPQLTLVGDDKEKEVA